MSKWVGLEPSVVARDCHRPDGGVLWAQCGEA